MLFNSYLFIFCFLPLALVGWFGLHRFGRHTLAKVFLTGMSLWFYGFFHPRYLLVICGSIVFNYGLSTFCFPRESLKRFRKGMLIVGIAGNLALIFYFKYFNFFMESICGLFREEYILREIILPLGISFFTFQQISYLIESYRGRIKEGSFADYALFVTFFPQLVAGPIVTYEEMIGQFCDSKNYKLDMEMLNQGIFIFSTGLFKKVILADLFGAAVKIGWDVLPELTSAEAMIVMLAYTMQIYFDFSGYCDMASGIANMFHFRLAQNFDSPYKAVSITDFWKRWHMTLTRFLRTYVYFPLGGSRKGTVRTYINIMVVFLVSGIWHGAAWTFVVWGIVHGIGNCVSRMTAGITRKIPKVLRWLITFLYVNLTWIIFRAESLESAFIMLRKVLKPVDFRLQNIDLLVSFRLPEMLYLESHVPVLDRLTSQMPAVYAAGMFLVSLVWVLGFENLGRKQLRVTPMLAVGSACLLFWSVISLTGITTFLYFNF